ncbi:MAG: Gldg family protein [Gammaproteobacteria bacterium]|nr:Gldg family protein [Gammaproteobacteria bacterium]
MQHKSFFSSTGLLLAAALAIATIIIANATLTSLRLDLTSNKLFTLSEGTVNILNSLEEPVRLDFYFSKKTLVGFPALMNYGTRVRDLLEEYAAKSAGKIELTIIEPETFSEEEDQAVASGLQGVSTNTAGDRAYFGLVGSNATDDEMIIPFFQSERQAALEYDITKLIYNLANPKKRVIGIISTLPVFGDARQVEKPWAIISTLREFFEVRDLGVKPDEIEQDIDVLMVIHPKDVKDKTLFAIEQFMLAGGNAMLFVDPLAEADRSQPDPEQPMVMPDLDSDLRFLFDGWGIEIAEGKIVADINAAMRVQTRSERGPQEVIYLPWLRLGETSFNKDDFSTSEIKLIHMGTVGSILQSEQSTLEFIPLIQTSTESMKLERDLIMIQRDPNVILENFKSEDKRQILATRLSGHVNTAYPEGLDGEDSSTLLQEGDINIILVADTDILNDLFWIRTQNFFGMEMPQAIANNGDFIVNSLENLSGNNDLISLRSRGEFSRPFSRVEKIRRAAEDEFRERERQLQSKLQETEKRMQALQKDASSSDLILSAEQNREIEKFREVQLTTRKELRAVQHELQKNIERLGTQLKFINIGLMPMLITIIAIVSGVYRSRRRA